MSMHKLTAGSGYDYLTRQVAAQDVTEKGHTGLASYYAAKGESPGVWVGSGVAGIEGLAAGDVVTAEEMQALFGSGHHPLADARMAALGDEASPEDFRTAARLGRPYRVYGNDVSAFRIEVAQRLSEHNAQMGQPSGAPVPVDVRASIRDEVGAKFFRDEHGRDPADARELAAGIAKYSRPKTRAVAGYDLTFSPVKSVSTLWALADPATAARIEKAHQGAIKDALAFLEEHALYTRTGTNGVRQVDVKGLVATAFTHRDSRAGDPDLHTHVAVANKVQTEDGQWLAIDGRVLFKAVVSASETYNTALEKHLRVDLGLRFEERATADARKRPVREVVGVSPELNQRWSARRALIAARQAELTAQFQRDHARPPTSVEAIQLASQATLETRDAKKEPRSLAEQRQTWRQQAGEVLGDEGIARMLHAATHPSPATPTRVTDRWVRDTAAEVIATVQARRSTWQTWHVRAEAQRRVRAMDLAPQDVERIVTHLTERALGAGSVRLRHPEDGIEEPSSLRRRDGSSVYTVHGTQQYTSIEILAAERRIVAAAAHHDRHAASPEAVDLALLESVANGTTLNAGQAALVRQMATSGARVQLAIAPAGAGKTTAMKALATAWENDGGTVLGLAPSAAAASALREQIDTSTDTLAKLAHSIRHDELPEWARSIGPETLVIIDEAGMADTLTLDTTIVFVLSRGGSVRLIGDDQQLAAIGAGGVLRDIATSHGALRLTELMRFSDPGEGAASLALREGSPEALGYYLDHGRVHVGDLTTITEDVFAAWQIDRAHGRDSIMLAPTRDLVSELNQRAQAHRLDGQEPSRTAPLSDGNRACVGDLLITRANERRLRMTATDWVKNGDRWTVTDVHRDGSLAVQHAHTRKTLTLPADYVAASTELGYATTVHAAQGVSVDTMHGLATGCESRQQIYTMLTRGRHSNHVYLQVVGDGDEHNAIRPEAVAPPTATDILEGILARDASPVSASTLLREGNDPTRRLGEATARYCDALHFAAQERLGPDAVTALEEHAETLLRGLTEQPAWPTLRSHLILRSAHGIDPNQALSDALHSRDIDSAVDAAAVLDWRIDHAGARDANPAPLPWLPGIPRSLADDPAWGDYLTARADLTTALAAEVREEAHGQDLPWLQDGARCPDAPVIADVAVWRAATQVDPTDRRPTGAPQTNKLAVQWQRHLNNQLSGTHTPAILEWGASLRALAPQVGRDPFVGALAERLAAMSRAGINPAPLVTHAMAQGPLPDDHAAAALWWRLSQHVPAVDTDTGSQLATTWDRDLAHAVGRNRSEDMHASPAWSRLVATIDHALQRGMPLNEILRATNPGDAAADIDECQAMIWRLTLLTEAVDTHHDHEPPPPEEDQPPHDLWHGAPVHPSPTSVELETLDDRAPVPAPASNLDFAAMRRELMGPLEPSYQDIQAQERRAAEADLSPIPIARLLQVNNLTRAYYEQSLPGSWAHQYLHDRFGMDLTGHPDFAPGYAPQGWTRLVDHLHQAGVTGDEMLAAGVATVASTGRLIDRFRDRAIFPITHQGEVLGFVGRRHPDLTDDDRGGPKYLNTAQTVPFHKGAQLFGAPSGLPADATPVLVEGPMDAIAVTLSSNRHVGVAPLGTSLTSEQATQLAEHGSEVLVATDADLAGQIAAERAFWLLAQHNLATSHVSLPTGSDPADLLANRGARALALALVETKPLSHVLLDERLTNLTGKAAQDAAMDVLAASAPDGWATGLTRIASATQQPHDDLTRLLGERITAWNHDPRTAAQDALNQVAAVRARLEAGPSPEGPWIVLARDLDPRLPDESDWPAVAWMLDEAQQAGLDVEALAHKLVSEERLSSRPAQDLRYRIAAAMPGTPPTPEATVAKTHAVPGTQEERRQTPPSTTVQQAPRL